MKPVFLTCTVPAALDGAAVSTLLRQELSCSGTLIKQVKVNGLRLDGIRVILSDRVKAGSVLRLQLPEDPSSDIIPVSHPLDILFEDEHLLIVNKPPRIPVHPGPNHHEDTLGNFITAHYQSAGEAHLFRPVNRLDRGTSGLMAVAKHSYAQEILKGQLHSGAFRRRYLAVCDGIPEPDAGTISAPIGRLDGSVIARMVRPDGASAVTHYQVLKRGGERALVRLELETGRTHQIRVHMSHLGCPLTGDFLYGREQPDLISRPALHSAELSLLHPVTQKALSFTCPLPDDIKNLL